MNDIRAMAFDCFGALDPDRIHTPGAFVSRVVEAVNQKRIEQQTVSG